MTQDIRTIRIATQGPCGPAGPQGPTGTAGAIGPQGTAGATGTAGPQRFAGPNGATGATGAAGVDGKTVRSGSGAPSSGLGADGDFYIDTTASQFYGPKTSGAWGSPASMVISVAGRSGAVTLAAGDISGLAASATTDTTSASNISSGTLNNARLSGVPRVLAISNVESTVLTGTTSLGTFATISVPANTMGANGILRITLLFRYTGTAGAKTAGLTFGGTSFLFAPTAVGALSGQFMIIIRNRNATNSQVSTPSTSLTPMNGGIAADIATGSVDTTASQNLVIQGQLANSGDSIALESYLVEVIAP